MNIMDDVSEHCIGCGACACSCPKQAINMVFKDGFLYPTVDKNKCVECGICLKECPAMNRNECYEISEAYVAVTKNDKVYESSTSGGVFAEIAIYFLRKYSAVICGAAWTSDYMVEHILIDKEEELNKIQGSKYVQSRTDKVFPEIKELLKFGKHVLFSGTPCQIAALKDFLKESYCNLLCVDIVCHGVPSPQMLQNHIKKLTKSEGGYNVMFRTKDKYDRYGFNLVLSQGTKEKMLISGNIDPYFRLFINNYIFREACYSCKYACSMRIGDITIGDCGNSEIYIERLPYRTLSTVYPITDRGKKVWEEIKVSFDFLTVNKDIEIAANSQLTKPSVRPKERDFIYSSNEDISLLAQRCLGKVTTRIKMKERVKRIIPEKKRKRLVRTLKRVIGK